MYDKFAVKRYADAVEAVRKTEANKEMSIVDKDGLPYRKKDIQERTYIVSDCLQEHNGGGGNWIGLVLLSVGLLGLALFLIHLFKG